MKPILLSPETRARARGMGFRIPEQHSFFTAAPGGYNFAATNVDDLWTPERWIQAAAEPVVGRLMLLNSGIVAQHERLRGLASGGGTKVNLPRYREPKPGDEVQSAPDNPTINALASGMMVAPILRRRCAIGAEALAGAVSGAFPDPISYIGQVIGIVRLRNREITLLNILRGFFGDAAADLSEDNFSETGASPAAANLIDSVMFADATARLGENIFDLTSGAMVVHSDIHAALLKQDDIEFIRDSEGRLVMETYRGIPLFINDLLTRDGSTSGKVYDSYIFAPGVIAEDEKPQTSRIGDTASLTMKEDAHTNNVTYYDRTQCILHPNGAIWDGTPAGETPSNAELANPANWDLDGDPKNVGIVRIRTNG